MIENSVNWLVWLKWFITDDHSYIDSRIAEMTVIVDADSNNLAASDYNDWLYDWMINWAMA